MFSTDLISKMKTTNNIYHHYQQVLEQVQMYTMSLENAFGNDDASVLGSTYTVGGSKLALSGSAFQQLKFKFLFKKDLMVQIRQQKEKLEQISQIQTLKVLI